MFNIIFPVFNAIDAWLGLLLPLIARISVWGITAGTIAMGIYVIISDQAAISNCKLEIRSLRKDMMDTSIDTYSEYSQIALQNLKTSLALLGKVIVPTMLSALPVLLIALWLDSHDNYTISGEQYTVPVKIVPNNKNVRIYPQNLERYIDNGIALRIPPTPSEEITFKIDDYIVYSGKLFWKPTPVLSKKKWWNILSPAPRARAARPKNLTSATASSSNAAPSPTASEAKVERTSSSMKPVKSPESRVITWGTLTSANSPSSCASGEQQASIR